MVDQNMECLKLNCKNKKNLAKFWLYAFYKLYLKTGYKLKAFNWLKLFVCKLNILLPKTNLNNFFSALHKKFSLQIAFRKRTVSGKTLKIPVFINQEKVIWFNARFIFNSIKNNSEKNILDKLITELIYILKNKGATFKKYQEFKKDIKLLIPNNRFLEKKK